MVQSDKEKFDLRINFVDLRLKLLTLFGCEVETLAGFEDEGDVEIGLNVVQGVAFHCETLLKFDDL